MARATKVPVDDFEVRLTLTRLEAETLAEVMMHIGGNPHRSRRGLTDGIGSALINAGVAQVIMDHYMSGGIKFENEELPVYE